MRLTQRLQLIKFTVLIGMFASVLLSYNLWAGERWFPKTPFFYNYIGLTAPFDYLNLFILIILLYFSFTSTKKYITLLLIVFCIYLCFDDQNRMQPWFYNYILILFVLLFYKSRVDEPNNYTTIFISLQLLVSLIYIFSGIQKLNDSFASETFQWMMNSLDFILSKRQIGIISNFGNLIPYFEIGIGCLLLVKQMRFIIVPLLITMHVLILILLGPTGKNYNSVIWPWNFIMIALILLLFSNVKQERFYDISFLFKGTTFYLVITLMLIFPFFSLKNQYDSYLSSSLYSSNLNDCKITLSDKAYNKLPYYIRRYCTSVNNEHLLYVKKWSMDELNVPCVPEYRIFKSIHYYLINLTETDSSEIKFEFIERKKIIK
jgi:hypothetical protein